MRYLFLFLTVFSIECMAGNPPDFIREILSISEQSNIVSTVTWHPNEADEYFCLAKNSPKNAPNGVLQVVEFEDNTEYRIINQYDYDDNIISVNLIGGEANQLLVVTTGGTTTTREYYYEFVTGAPKEIFTYSGNGNVEYLYSNSDSLHPILITTDWISSGHPGKWKPFRANIYKWTNGLYKKYRSTGYNNRLLIASTIR